MLEPHRVPSDITDAEILALRTVDECAAVMQALDLKIASIEAQVFDKSRDYDPEWYRRARFALKLSKKQRQLAQERRGQLRRAEKSENIKTSAAERLEWDRNFVEVAKDNLPPAEYRRLCDLASARLRASDPTPLPAEPVAQSVPGLCLGG